MAGQSAGSLLLRSLVSQVTKLFLPPLSIRLEHLIQLTQVVRPVPLRRVNDQYRHYGPQDGDRGDDEGEPGVGVHGCGLSRQSCSRHTLRKRTYAVDALFP